MSGIIAVTGATGYIGRFVVAELARRGLMVRALARAESNRDGFNTRIEWITGGLRSEAALAELVQGVAAVIHLAYEHVPGRYRGGEGADLSGWLDANVNGSLRLLVAAQQAGVPKFIFLSSRAVFSHTEPGRELDETHPTSPDTHYGAYKVAVEAFLKSFAQVTGIKTYSVRATGVYGLTWPVERSKWWALVTAVLNNQTVTSSGGGTEVYGADVARVIGELVERPLLPFDTVHLSDRYVTHREVVELARRLANRPGPLPPLPAAPPQNQMVSRYLADLGVTLGGVAALENTVSELLQAVQVGLGF
ncbi:MAG TPA: NAD(P)-dependent oxidoreductase [Phototrophicaceae bacterium]|nr:NAD(P)-dependent oxidoreductase [Phototrophicaceae bacterium]